MMMIIIIIMIMIIIIIIIIYPWLHAPHGPLSPVKFYTGYIIILHDWMSCHSDYIIH
jgi:hypothetical protein